MQEIKYYYFELHVSLKYKHHESIYILHVMVMEALSILGLAGSLGKGHRTISIV